MSLYENCLNDLYSRKFPKQDSFYPFKQLLENWGSPQKDYPVVHVAGTNGKGQVAGAIATALAAAGYKTGLFTSPHLFRYTERIKIDGVEIPEEKILQFYQEMVKEPHSELINFFEATCLFGFRYFQEEGVDIAVIEAGIGGLYDSTNLVTPILSVITSIGIDHSEVLGETLEKIAWQKAGIIKPGAPVVIGPSAQLLPILRRAEEMGVNLYPVVDSPKLYLEENEKIVEKALEVLQKPFPMNSEAIQKGLHYRPLCRFEKRGELLLDVAHNPMGLSRLISALNQFYPEQKTLFVAGLKKEKDLENCLRQIDGKAKSIFWVDAPPFSPCPADDTLSSSLTVVSSVTEGMQRALDAKEDHDLIVVCGSFYLMKEAIEFSMAMKERN